MKDGARSIEDLERLVLEDSIIRDGYIQAFIGFLAGAGLHNSGAAIVRRTTIRGNWSRATAAAPPTSAS